MYSKILENILQLTEPERKRQLSIELGQKGFIPDEVASTLMLRSWHERWPDRDTYAQYLIQRLVRHVRAHVRKNPGWQKKGGGFEVTTEDFCQDISEHMIKDKAQPCHAEVAFGDYVKKRCLDCADKLYAKKRDAGVSFDVDGIKGEVEKNQGDGSYLYASSPLSPEDQAIQIEEFVEEYLADKQNLLRIKNIVLSDLPDNERIAFSLHHFEKLKVFSKKPEMTVCKLMGVGESSVRHYLTNARKIIKEKLT